MPHQLTTIMNHWRPKGKNAAIVFKLHLLPDENNMFCTFVCTLTKKNFPVKYSGGDVVMVIGTKYICLLYKL